MGNGIIESLDLAVSAANSAAGAGAAEAGLAAVAQGGGATSEQQMPRPISLSSVTIPQFALMMEGLSLERFVRLRQEVEGYVELGQRLRCARIADIVY